MTWWGVRLDGVALINLIMCIGFSVDFSAHICYHYITEDDKCPNDRIRGSLYALGVPILQGAGSTITGVLGLAFAPSYLFVTFFKMIFLVIMLGALHGLVLLPVLLSLFGTGTCSSKQSKSSSKSTRSSGISTPTTISCGNLNQSSSCHAVNFGFISSSASDSFPTINIDRVRQRDAFSAYEGPRYPERQHNFTNWTPDFTDTARSDLSVMDRFALRTSECRRKQHISTHEMEEKLANSSASSPFGPVIRAATFSRRKNVKGQKLAITGESANTATEDTSVASTSSSSTTTPRMQKPATVDERLKRSKMNYGESGHGSKGSKCKDQRRRENAGNSHRSISSNHHHHRSNYHGGSVAKCPKKRILSRSKSQLAYSPNGDADIQFVPNGDTWRPPSPSQATNVPRTDLSVEQPTNTGKHPLRKYYSVPYHSFINDDSCSSDESFNERTRRRQHQLFLLRQEQDHLHLQDQYNCKPCKKGY